MTPSFEHVVTDAAATAGYLLRLDEMPPALIAGRGLIGLYTAGCALQATQRAQQQLAEWTQDIREQLDDTADDPGQLTTRDQLHVALTGLLRADDHLTTQISQAWEEVLSACRRLGSAGFAWPDDVNQPIPPDRSPAAATLRRRLEELGLRRLDPPPADTYGTIHHQSQIGDAHLRVAVTSFGVDVRAWRTQPRLAISMTFDGTTPEPVIAAVEALIRQLDPGRTVD